MAADPAHMDKTAEPREWSGLEETLEEMLSRTCFSDERCIVTCALAEYNAAAAKAAKDAQIEREAAAKKAQRKKAQRKKAQREKKRLVDNERKAEREAAAEKAAAKAAQRAAAEDAAAEAAPAEAAPARKRLVLTNSLQWDLEP